MTKLNETYRCNICGNFVQLLETGAGVMVDFQDEENTKKAILDYYNRFKSGSLKVQSESIERFSRRSLTGELSKLLNSL